jgi:hypothetical protein
MSKNITQGSLASVSAPVGHIAPRKPRKVAVLSWLILSLVLTLALVTGLTVRSAATSNKDHMRAIAKDHMRTVAKDHMRMIAKDHMRAIAKDHMDV